MKTIEQQQKYMFVLMAHIRVNLPLKESKIFAPEKWLVCLEGIYYFIELATSDVIISKINSTEKHRINYILSSTGLMVEPAVVAQNIADVLGIEAAVLVKNTV